MSGHCNIPHPLKREGTYQWQRFPAALDKNFYRPDDRSLEEIVMQVAEYASFVKYYDTTMNEWGTWEPFFDFLYDYSAKKLKFKNIDSLLQRADLPPHLGLLLAFLKTFQAVRDQFNDFTGRHLDFYYKDVLQLKEKTAVADKVAVLFEPEKNTVQARVEQGRPLNAGKDATGKDLVYTTLREIVVNQAAIAKKKTVYADKNTTGGLRALHISADAPADNKFIHHNITSWRPFGSTANQKAEIGFAVSSPLLFAKEGRRRLSIEIEGGALLPRTSLRAVYTGPKKWEEAVVDIVPGIDGINSVNAKKFLLIKFDESLPAIVGYDDKIHKSGLSTPYPVVKLLLKNDNSFPAAYEFFSVLKLGAFKKIVMNVEGAQSFTISGENGRMNPLQAFKPFGNAPVKNKSFFTIGFSQAFNKYLKTFHLAANWKGAPGNMAKYYGPYETYLRDVAKKETTGGLTAFGNQWPGFNQGNVPGKVELLSGGKWVNIIEDKNAHYIARNPGTYNTFHPEGSVIKDKYETGNSNEYSEDSRWGFARVTLKYDFGHQYFPVVLSDTASKNAHATSSGNVTPLPPPPYTPEFNSLRLDYVLEDTLDLTGKPEHQFIQLHPFGVAGIQSAVQPIVPADYTDNGQLYIGLSHCTVPQTVNLYLARLDGTEDIDALIHEKIKWYYLSGNAWHVFRFEEITVNTTHDFTSSGFISFAIPAAALMTNSIMGENLVWIKAVSATSANAYPFIIDIHANAAEAEFSDRVNDPAHLQAALPAGTITKPLLKIEGVKALAQPYASYDNKMAEQDRQFYTRVSERLRHKDRSWSIWDYEHMVLEKFPSIFKIKCISHAIAGDMYMPGRVLCVALPATINIAEKDLLQPRVSKATLTAAAEYVKTFMTTFAAVEFVNPVYEPITVTCRVKIKPGYDESFYAAQLNKELQQYISPWIANRNSSPSFGGKIYASAIINFIEERPYIDYLAFFEASKLEDGRLITWKEFTAGSSEEVILTSAPQHIIDTNAVC